MSEDEIKIKLSPYLGCSKKLIEFFAIIGYEEKDVSRYIFNPTEIQKELKITFLSLVISDISFNFDPAILIKQIYPDNPPIIKSNIYPRSDNIIFSSCIDSLTGDRKIVNSGYALRFYEKIEAQNGDVFFIPKALLIYSQYPYFSSYCRICEKILISTDERYADKDFPIEIFVHCLVNYFPSPINNNLVLKDFVPNIIIPKLTGYPYADFNLGKVLTSLNLNDFIKIYILIFLEIDLLFVSPDLEKLNIIMFALYILNYPLTDSIYFWHVRSISYEDLKKGKGNDGASTNFIGVNFQYEKLDFDEFNAPDFMIDIDDKKQPIKKTQNSEDAEDINLLLKYINNIFTRSIIIRRKFFIDKYILRLHENLKNVIKDYNETAKNDSNVAYSFFYMNQSIFKINRRIQEIFYDFVLNILVELNKDYIINESTKKENTKKIDEKISEEERIFIKFTKNTVKYGLYFKHFIKSFITHDELKVSLLFSDEYVNLKKDGAFDNMEDKIQYFDIMDKLFTLKRDDLKFDLKALDTEYSKMNYIPSSNKKASKKFKELFVLDQDIIKKFIYKKKNKNFYESLTEPEEIKVDTDNKNSLIFTIQYYLSLKGLLKSRYYIRCSTTYLISICIFLFPKGRIPFILDEYLQNCKKIKYFQRFYIFMILKAINKYYQLNKETGFFPEMEAKNVHLYYDVVQNHIKENSIVEDEELSKFFEKHSDKNEKEISDNIKHENEFIYNLDNYYFEEDINNINKNYKTVGNEIHFYLGKTILKTTIIKDEDIKLFFQELYSYYEFFLSKDFDIKNIDVYKLSEKALKLIKLFMYYKDEQNFIIILYNLVCSLFAFQKQLSDYQNKKST